MDYIITEVFLDISNRYRVRAIIDDNNAEFFMFDHYPTQEEVNAVVQTYIDNKTLPTDLV